MPVPRAELPRVRTALPSLVVVIGLVVLFANFSWRRFALVIVLIPLGAAIARASVRTAVQARDSAARFADRVYATGGTQGPDLKHCQGCQYVLLRTGAGEDPGHFSTSTHMSGFRGWAEKRGARFAPAAEAHGKAPDKDKG
ncbi:hypothetical protein [Streptomyces sp. LN499]|uniref:hypothetical protein n=1 Tax=Streptomyces sp. LN499 TaxID=3112977 RepID=UPI003721ABA2